MRFKKKEIRLKDGRTCILRPVKPEDASDMLKYLEQTSGETDFLLRYPDEFTITLDSEKAFLEKMLDNPDSVMMTATVDGKLAGNSSLNRIDTKRKLRHRCSMAIALYQEYWNLGIGTAMIAYLTELAIQIGYEQIDLEVVAENTRARALYACCGFIESGRRHHAMKFDDGSYHDEILMYKEITGKR